MKIPKAADKRLELFRDLAEVCLVSRDDRIERYAMFRNYFLYGMSGGEEQTAWNNCFPSIDLLTSFLYAADTTKFSVNLGVSAKREEMKRSAPAAKRILELWKQSNADTIFEQALTWSLVYDSTLVKFIRRGKYAEPFFVDPGCFGVMREDVPMLDRQEAFIHVYYISPSELERRLMFHPRRDSILRGLAGTRVKKDTPNETPGLIERVAMSAVTPDLIGEANVALDVLPNYKAQLGEDVIEMGELWVWNDEEDDYQIVTMADQEHVIYDRPNFFMPRSELWESEHCFVQICPNPLPDYF